MTQKTYFQDPAETRTYRLSLSGDTVARSTAAISPSTGVTLSATRHSSTTVDVDVSALTLGTKYTLTLHIVGASGQEYEQSGCIRCEQQ